MSANNARAYAPATVSNINVGFELLGYPVNNIGDTVSIRKIKKPEVIIKSIKGANLKITDDPLANTAGAPLVKLIEDKNLGHGFELEIEKGIPIGSGLGGSAASAVASVLAANELLADKMNRDELIKYALIGETVATGAKHGDNVIPCLNGGLTLITSLEPLRIIDLPVPSIHSVVFFPHISIKTSDARNILKKEVDLLSHTNAQAQLAGFLSGLYTQNPEVMKEHFEDVIIEPQRSRLIPGFEDAKRLALELGAIGFGISGSGPTMFCWASSEQSAKNIEKEVTKVLQKSHEKVSSWSGEISLHGAQIV